MTAQSTLLSACVALTLGTAACSDEPKDTHEDRAGGNGPRITMPGSPFGIAWGFLYGYQGVKAEDFLPRIRQLGAGCTKIYLFWNQVEPEKGRYDWSAVDRFVAQLQSPEEGLIAIFSSSTLGDPAARISPSPITREESGRLLPVHSRAGPPLQRPRSLLAKRLRAQQSDLLVGDSPGLRCAAQGLLQGRQGR